jgi:hypothetical protein
MLLPTRAATSSTRASSRRRGDDACLILGAGYPFFRGGLTPYLDESGASERHGREVPGGRRAVCIAG